GTDHYELVVKPAALDVRPNLAWHLDEPFAAASAIPTHYVPKITREHVTVALSGDGGDESFAGYRRYAQAMALAARMDRGPARMARPLLRLTSRLLPVGARGQAWTGMRGGGTIDRHAPPLTHERPDNPRHALSDARP